MILSKRAMPRRVVLPLIHLCFSSSSWSCFLKGCVSPRQLMRQAADSLSIRWYLGYQLDESLPDHSSLTRIRTRYAIEVFRRFFEQEQSPLPRPLHPALDAGVHAALTQINRERHDWIERLGEPNREVTRGHYQRLADFRVSTTDPDATLMQGKGGGSRLGYHTHYVVDGGKARIIVAALVTPSEVMENQPVLDLVFRARARWKLHPQQFTGDTTYGAAENIVALEEQHIRAYVPLPDFDQQTPLYGKHAFRYDAEHDVYICPNESVLPLHTYAYTEREKRYQAAAATCNACPLKSRCTTSDQGRVLKRGFDEEYLDRVRAYHPTEEYHKAMRKRSVWVEPLFARAAKTGMA